MPQNDSKAYPIEADVKLARDTIELDIIEKLAELGDNEAKAIIKELGDITFQISYNNLKHLPSKSFIVSFDSITIQERLEVMEVLKIYNNLDEKKKEDIYHIFSKYDLGKEMVLDVLVGKVSFDDLILKGTKTESPQAIIANACGFKLIRSQQRN